MTNIIQKTFLASLNEISSSKRLLEKYLTDKRLTRSEKQIIQCWILLRKSNFKKVIEIASKLPGESDILNSQKYLLLGISNNNSGQPDLAKENLLKSMSLLKQYTIDKLVFICASNLFIAGFNGQDKQMMEDSLKTMKGLTDIDVKEYIIKDLCIFNYSFFCGEVDTAENYIKILDFAIKDMNASVQVNYLTSKFMFYVSVDKFNMCYKTLSDLKTKRAFRSNANTVFMKAMLDYITKGESIYAYHTDFKECELLYFQLKTIQAIVKGNDDQKLEFWDKLKQLNSKVYLYKDEYNGPKCLFSIALQKSLSEQVKHNTSLPVSSSNRLDLLNDILTNASVPLSKKHLFNLLWGRSPEGSKDNRAFKYLLTKYRNHYNNELVYENGGYQIISKDKLSA